MMIELKKKNNKFYQKKDILELKIFQEELQLLESLVMIYS